MSSCVTGKSTVCQVKNALNASERSAALGVSDADDVSKFGAIFRHDRILSLKMQTVNRQVYDLEVEGQSSYLANGLVVSNCRSTSIPVLKSWKELGIDFDEIPKTTRASMDGQVPADTTFEEWLKKQTVERQDRVLGVGKADLWRAGKIGFRDLLDQSGRPLSTEALRARHG